MIPRKLQEMIVKFKIGLLLKKKKAAEDVQAAFKTYFFLIK